MLIGRGRRRHLRRLQPPAAEVNASRKAKGETPQRAVIIYPRFDHCSVADIII